MFYAFNGHQARLPLWNNLKRIATSIRGPWAVAGDFNNVLSVTERVGGAVSQTEIEPFRDCLEDCGLVDIFSTGALFTWNNKQHPETRVYSRIDRFLINKEWSDALPEAAAHFHPEGLYDHCSCIVHFSPIFNKRERFKYYYMWGKSEEFGPLLRRNWRRDLQGYPMYTLTRNLRSLKHALKDLNKRSFSEIEARAASQEQKVKTLQEDIGKNPTRERIEEEHEALQELKRVAEARDEFMAQKLKGNWVLEGDANTVYFHATLKGRRDQNKVTMLEDMDGVICASPQAIKTAFMDYYQQLLG
ncbi:hypothetical protein vseg_015213 [Gypsophila vaccaria]